MSNEVRPGVEIALEDRTVTIYPVSLKQLRKLRVALEAINFEANDGYPDDDAIDGMVKAAQVILEKVDPELANNYEEVEDKIDIRSFNLMVAAAMGADPNELGAMIQAA